MKNKSLSAMVETFDSSLSLALLAFLPRSAKIEQIFSCATADDLRGAADALEYLCAKHPEDSDNKAALAYVRSLIA